MGLILAAIGAIVAAAVSVTKALAVVGLAVQGLKVIGNAITSIAKALGIIKPERDVEELGDRALQAEEKGITPDKFESYEAWVREIEKDDWGYDPDKNRDMSPEQKVMKGVEVSSGVLIERFPDISIQTFLSASGKNPEFFTPERMGELGKLAANDESAFKDVVNYVSGTAKDHVTIDSAVDTMMEIEKTLDPNLSDDAAYDKVTLYKDMK